MKKFWVVWSGQVLSLFGSNIVTFALVWYLTKETGSATVLATASLVAMLPALILMPFIGAWVDRWNRKRIMIVVDLCIAVATIGLAALFLTGNIQIWHIYVLNFVRSIGGAFQGPAMMASTPLLVPKKHLTRVAGLNQMVAGGMNIITPPLGALFLEILPMQGVLAIDVVTALIAVGCLLFIAIPQPERILSKVKPSIFIDIKQGFKLIWSWPGVTFLLGAAAFMNFFGAPLGSLLPIVVRKVFQGGAVEFGWMQSALGIGMVVGGLTLAAWGGFKKRIFTSIMGLIILGVSLVVAGLTPSNLLVLFIVTVFVFGLAQTFANGPVIAILQAKIPKEMQGRVFTLTGVIAMMMSPLGLLAAGPISDRIGVQMWYFIAGIVVISMGTAQLFMPAVRNIENHKVNAKIAASVATPENMIRATIPDQLD